MENLLQAFLDAQLLKGIDDNEQFNYLKAAAQDLLGKGPKHRLDLIPLTLIALDPTVSENEPALDRVESAIKKHWAPFKNKFPSRPIQVLRAVLLEAVRLKTVKDDFSAAVVWFTGATYFQNKQYGAQEEPVLREFLLGLAERVEAAAESDWIVDREVSANGDINSAFSISNVNKNQLQTSLLYSAGPTTDDQGVAISAANANLPAAGAPWATEFSKLAAVGIAKTIDDNNAQLERQLNDVVGELLKGLAGSISVLNRRYDLLWWRHSLYSPSLKRSYRGLEPSTMCLVVGFDVYKMLPDFYPQSLEFVLRETISTLTESVQKDYPTGISILDFLKNVHKSPYTMELQLNYGKKETVGSGKMPLVDLVKGVLSGQDPSTQWVESRLGISSEQQIPFTELTVWLLRDQKAQQLAGQKVP
jgi:hypothetical protein